MNKIIKDNSIDLSLLFKKFKPTVKELRGVFLLGLSVTLLVYFLSDRLYTSYSVIAPISSASKGDVTSVLAAQFGIAGEIEIDPQTIFESEELKKNIIYEKRIIDGEITNLIDFWKLNEFKWYNPLHVLSLTIDTLFNDKDSNSIIKDRIIEVKAMKKLNKRLSYSQDFYTDEIRVSSTMEKRNLAMSINEEIISYINNFITESKNKDAASKVYYMEKRIEEVKDELNVAEDRLEEFLNLNKSYVDSPKLFREFMTLKREVELKAAVKIQLNTQMEIIKIDEVNEVPNFIVVNSPTFPSKKVYPRGSYFLLYLMIGFFAIVCSVIIFRDLRKD